MSRQPHPSKGFVWILLLTFIAAPALAHKVQVAEDVGGTLHIEPNDTPRAGEPSLTWFALTRKGGQVIPLEQCNCQLLVYAQAGASPVLTPPLKAVSAERYQNIPGAEIQFPQPGSYQLKLSGAPKSGATFKPFELTFDVTVATGTSTSPQAIKPTRQPNQPSRQWQAPIIIGLGVLGLGLLWGVLRRRK